MTMRFSHLSRQHLQEVVGTLSMSLTGEMQKQMRQTKKAVSSKEVCEAGD